MPVVDVSTEKFSNLTLTGNVTISGNKYVGGGSGSQAEANFTYNRITVGSEASTIKIEGEYSIGGIVGGIETSGSSTIKFTTITVKG